MTILIAITFSVKESSVGMSELEYNGPNKEKASSHYSYNEYCGKTSRLSGGRPPSIRSRGLRGAVAAYQAVLDKADRQLFITTAITFVEVTVQKKIDRKRGGQNSKGCRDLFTKGSGQALRVLVIHITKHILKGFGQDLGNASDIWEGILSNRVNADTLALIRTYNLLSFFVDLAEPAKLYVEGDGTRDDVRATDNPYNELDLTKLMNRHVPGDESLLKNPWMDSRVTSDDFPSATFTAQPSRPRRVGQWIRSPKRGQIAAQNGGERYGLL
ncbi:hypothetical protein B0T10DRAFT_464583 [Thelonectria olida]|uniref:Uncharacterized protein n=1 Tax=Thelonectria olida TaxID=1576542 RepID=A0A9P9AKS0_9HYPO|nr:hypothetical protein B0T10DRAFT_464583 [Thelonectria olida]